jgi:hypothetical protein
LFFLLDQKERKNQEKTMLSSHKATSARSRYATGQAVFSGTRSVNASHLLDGGGSEPGFEMIFFEGDRT